MKTENKNEKKKLDAQFEKLSEDIQNLDYSAEYIRAQHQEFNENKKHKHKKEDQQSTSNQSLVKAEHVYMRFKVPGERMNTLKERFVALARFKKRKHNIFEVLKDINFEIKKGESLGIIGHNGVGKTTLLKIVAGIYRPTQGSIEVNGTVMPLLNLGAGFDMEANAIENIYLNGAILGFSRKEMKNKLQSIIEFSELQDFTKLPLKNYSSGMTARLGFAIAIDVQPDLMLVDEVLSVGDENFRQKCNKKIDELKAKGTSFMVVSHSIQQIKRLCQKCLWIENSKVQAYGATDEVCAAYEAF